MKRMSQSCSCRRSVDGRVKAIVVRRAEQWSHRVAEMPAISGRFIVVEGLGALSSPEQGDMADVDLDRLNDIIAQIAFALARRLGDLFDGRERRRKAGRKYVEMKLHGDGAAGRRRLRRSDADGVIVAPVKGRAHNGGKLAAKLDGTAGLLVGVVSRRILPGFIDHEPVGPTHLLQQIDAQIAGLLAPGVAVLLEDGDALGDRIRRDIETGDPVDRTGARLRPRGAAGLSPE